MKCPKCRYVSFDYNQVCPMCEKDLMAVRNSLNLPDFRPNPPFLLGILTGDAEQGEFEPGFDAFTHITDIEGEDLELHLETEIPEGPAEATSTERAAEPHSQEKDSYAHPAPEQTLYDEAEMVTSRIDKKKKGPPPRSGAS
jgi:hypothetical protein